MTEEEVFKMRLRMRRGLDLFAEFIGETSIENAVRDWVAVLVMTVLKPAKPDGEEVLEVIHEVDDMLRSRFLSISGLDRRN